MHNINTIKHGRKKHVSGRFYYSLTPMNTTKIFHPLQSKENLIFSKKYLKQQQAIFFLILRKIQNK
jgi:hypothetical protein